jgi:hypothetical protein
VRVIAKQFGVDLGTVQRISGPFDGANVIAGIGSNPKALAVTREAGEVWGSKGEAGAAS